MIYHGEKTAHLFPLKLFLPKLRYFWGSRTPRALLAEFDLSIGVSILSARHSHLVAPGVGVRLLNGRPRLHGALKIELYGSPECIDVIVSDLLGPSDIKIGFDEARRLAAPHIVLGDAALSLGRIARSSAGGRRIADAPARILGENVISFPMRR